LVPTVHTSIRPSQAQLEPYVHPLFFYLDKATNTSICLASVVMLYELRNITFHTIFSQKQKRYLVNKLILNQLLVYLLFFKFVADHNLLVLDYQCLKTPLVWLNCLGLRRGSKGVVLTANICMLWKSNSTNAGNPLWSLISY
jgi:hypothetical protein